MFYFLHVHTNLHPAWISGQGNGGTPRAHFTCVSTGCIRRVSGVGHVILIEKRKRQTQPTLPSFKWERTSKEVKKPTLFGTLVLPQVAMRRVLPGSDAEVSIALCCILLAHGPF